MANVTLEKLRGVTWGRTYLWEVWFPPYGDSMPPPPFDTWFPITDFRENVFTVQTMGFNVGASTFDIPSGSTLTDLNITFYDTEEHVLLDWFVEWAGKILNSGGYSRRLQTISEASRLLMVQKLDSFRDPIHTSSYLVYPKDAVYFEGNSQADIHKYSIPLISVKKVS